jgi:Protein kinase domain
VGEIAGTFPFMAPEQIANDPLTSAVDLFAWGSTMVFAATGGQAFPGDTREQVAHAIMSRPPRLEGVEEPLLASVRACLRKNPERRPTAGQARKLLFGRRPNSPPVAARPAKLAPPPTRVERPFTPPPTAPVQPPDGAKTWKAVAALVGSAVAAAVLIWAVPRISGDAAARQGAAPTSSPAPSPASPAAPRTLRAEFEAFWPGITCSPEPISVGMKFKDKCPVAGAAVAITMYCVEYEDMSAMTEQGRPGGERNNIDQENIDWRSEWYRKDSARQGAFAVYRLPDTDKSAIWWEDDTDPVACFLHGPPESGEDLVSAYQRSKFSLRDPVPSAP